MTKSLARQILTTRFRAFLRDSLKRGFWIAGFELAERGSVARSMATVLDVAKSRGFLPATIVDVGVAYGTAELYAAFPDARLLLIEPVQEWDVQLRKITRGRKTDMVWVAAGSQSSTLKINLYSDLGAATMLRERDAQPESTREVPVKRVDDICTSYGVLGPVLLKIDVQGAELDVLRGSEDILGRVEMIVVEVCLHQVYEDGSDFADVFTWLDSHGFCLFDICGSYCSPTDGTLQQIDIVAVPKLSPLRN
jgi:FkbM family methyltransferase